uniref:Anti-silencing function 1B histone chaperone n=1 Tax=Sphenodon punctatus TaxID=8508 RepID=A0A8D0L6P7_SPHPU
MARVSVLGMAVLENPGPFNCPLRFHVQFECREALPHDLEWKIIYVGSAESEEYDQVLESVPSLLGHPDFSQLQQNILASNPCVTRFYINWDGPSDQSEDIENVDPALGSVPPPPPACTPPKGAAPALGHLPENSMDCM